MKKRDRITASLLALILLICALPVSQLAMAARSESDGVYENDFDAADLATALGNDFEIRYDNENRVSATPEKLSVTEAGKYLALTDGRLTRINAPSENPNDSRRPYWQQVYLYYKNQSFKNFELSLDLTNTHDGFEMLHFAPATDGTIYSSGFTLAMKYNAFEKKYDLFLGDAGEARQDLDFFYVKQESTAAHATVTGKEKTVNVKIVFYNGTATAYIDGERVLEKSGFETADYYPAVTLGYNLAEDWQGAVDNFKIKSVKAAFERTEEDGKYTNNLDADSLSNALGNDFTVRYDHENWVSSSPKELNMSELAAYAAVSGGRIVRTNAPSETETDGRRPYWQQLYFYYKNQSFKNFEFSVDLTSTHDGFEMLHFAPDTEGTIYASGFTFAAKYNAFEKKYDLFLGNAAEVRQDLDFFYIKQESTAAHATLTGKEKTVNVKITFENGTAAAYIDGEKALEKSGLEAAAYYASVTLGYNLAADWQGAFDNFSFIRTGSETEENRTEEDGKYINRFNTYSLSNALGSDFAVRYDHENWVSNSPKELNMSELAAYAALLGGRIVRTNAPSETEADGRRPYWQQLYFYYKNQSFKNFEFSVDLTSTHDGFEMLHFAPDTEGTIYASGFTFAMKYNAFEKKYDLFLGNADEARQDLDFFYIKQDSTAAHGAVTGKEKTVNVKITFENGTAAAYIDGEKVLEKSGLDTVKYYPSVALGYNLAADWQGAFDNFSFINTVKEAPFERTEENGRYSTNFNSSGDSSLITRDFNFYYDTGETAENSLTDITNDPSKYINLNKNRLERVFDAGTEKNPWENGNRPYWHMAYYTYKNQKFRDFYLTVDAYMPMWGTSYNAITVGEQGKGMKSNGGFTLGFRNESETATAVYLGSADDVKVNFDDWYIHDCAGKAVFNHEANNFEFKIELAVIGGKASVTINGTEVLSNIDVGSVEGFISMVNGISAGSYFDNFSVTDYDKMEIDPEKQSKIVSIEKVSDIKWERTAENSNTNLLNLPETLKVTTDKGETVTRKIEWSSDDYIPSYPGTFTFKGTPVLPVNKTIINPDGIAASVKVTVTVDYNISTTVKFFIDALSDFNKNWVNMYSPNPKAEDYVRTTIDSVYYMDGGAIRRKDSAGNVGDHDEIESLIYTGRTFRNFRLDVDFRQGANTWGQAMVVFGIEDPDTYLTYNGGGAAAYLTMEGSARFRGQLVRDTNSYGESVSASEFKDYARTWDSQMHHMTLTVTKLKAVLEIDGTEVHECALREGYTGGYIGFMSNKNMAMYDNLSITTLDYDGNVITLEEHDNLPDTFDPNDPLIGEEEDDGSKAEIIGVDYGKNPNGKYGWLFGKGENGGGRYEPRTGDRFPLFAAAVITGLAAVALLVSLRLKKRSDKIQKRSS